MFNFDAYADEQSAPFSITAVDPETDKELSGYYDLLLKPNESKTLKVRVFNSSKNPIELSVEANTAWTNDNGITSYEKKDKKDDSLVASFEDMTEVSVNKLNIDTNGFKDILVDVKMPDRQISGQILGGIRVSQIEDKKKEQTHAVSNQYSYVIGVLLCQSKDKINPQILLNEVGPAQVNGKNIIFGNLQNCQPTIIKKLTAHAQIYDKDGNLRYEREANNMRMAPNSNFDYQVSLDDAALEPGDYIFKIEGLADDVAYKFSKGFTVSDKEAKQYNKTAVYVETQTGLESYVLILIVAVLLIIIGTFYYIYRKRKSNDN
ncbi:TPA: DUF916 and DUF3324 domain-containing protein [Enterococcus faecium]